MQDVLHCFILWIIRSCYWVWTCSISDSTTIDLIFHRLCSIRKIYVYRIHEKSLLLSSVVSVWVAPFPSNFFIERESCNYFCLAMRYYTFPADFLKDTKTKFISCTSPSLLTSSIYNCHIGNTAKCLSQAVIKEFLKAYVVLTCLLADDLCLHRTDIESGQLKSRQPRQASCFATTHPHIYYWL